MFMMCVLPFSGADLCRALLGLADHLCFVSWQMSRYPDIISLNFNIFNF